MTTVKQVITKRRQYVLDQLAKRDMSPTDLAKGAKVGSKAYGQMATTLYGMIKAGMVERYRVGHTYAYRLPSHKRVKIVAPPLEQNTTAPVVDLRRTPDWVPSPKDREGRLAQRVDELNREVDRLRQALRQHAVYRVTFPDGRTEMFNHDALMALKTQIEEQLIA